MPAFVDKKQESRSQAVANDISQKRNVSKSVFQFADNRADAIAQGKLQEVANNSAQVKQLRAFQEMADNSLQVRQPDQWQAIGKYYSMQQQRPIQKKEDNCGLAVVQMKKINMANGGSFESKHFTADAKHYKDISGVAFGLSRDELLEKESGLSNNELEALKKTQKMKKRDLWGASADMQMHYTLPNNQDIEKVGLVQITKPTVKVRNEGWRSFAAERAKKRITEGGWYFDRQTDQRHPIYGMDTKDESGEKVDYEKLAKGIEIEDRRGQYGTHGTPAVLLDKPSRISPLPFKHEFQTAALVVKGSEKVLGKYLGIVSWSYGHNGKKVYSEEIEKVRESSIPSSGFGGLTHVFRDSIKAWNSEKNEDNLPKNIKLPIDGSVGNLVEWE